MKIQPAMPIPTTNAAAPRWPTSTSPAHAALVSESTSDRSDLREAFDQFVGETFYGHMVRAMRKTVGKPAYFHGGRGEEVFRQQLDQLLVEHMTEATASQFTGPMFELFELGRQK